MEHEELCQETSQSCEPRHTRERRRRRWWRPEKGIPLAIRAMAVLHITSCLLLCSISFVKCEMFQGSEVCGHLPDRLSNLCVCQPIKQEKGLSLVCKGLNSTHIFNPEKEVESTRDNNKDNNILDFSSKHATAAFQKQVRSIVIRDSQLPNLELLPFHHFKNLQNLSVVQSKVAKVSLRHGRKLSEDLHFFNLSANNLDHLDKDLVQKSDLFKNLVALDLSGNKFSYLPNLQNSIRLSFLDLSRNSFNENIDPDFLKLLPSSIIRLDISENKWMCSPKLAWIYTWSRRTFQNALRNLDKTRCQYPNSHQTGALLLLMEYYTKHVIPSCPFSDRCTCLLTHVQEKHVISGERVYSVEVDCSNANLKHFPKLPKHTRIVNLSGNKLDDNSFAILKVESHNYAEVDNLTLDNNDLDNLPEKLLFMKLELRFSAKRNRLTSIPYDFFQRLIQSTDVIELSDNPWKCTCSSQITDLNLIAKVKDKDEMICGPTSDKELITKKIDALNPEVLCPPESKGEVRELIFQMLCVLFAFLLAFIPGKLFYDFWIYRTKGQLPWIALKMPKF